jgi:hypothetical protein
MKKAYSSSSHRYGLSRYLSETSLIRTSFPFFEIFTNSTIFSPVLIRGPFHADTAQGHGGAETFPYHLMVDMEVFKI